MVFRQDSKQKGLVHVLILFRRTGRLASLVDGPDTHTTRYSLQQVDDALSSWDLGQRLFKHVVLGCQDLHRMACETRRHFPAKNTSSIRLGKSRGDRTNSADLVGSELIARDGKIGSSFVPGLPPLMASPLLSGDLNDFILPAQACIKPVSAKGDRDNDASLSVALDLESRGSGDMDPVTISLNDCLACSGCITSAESVLVSQQTYQQLLVVLDANREATAAGLSRPQRVIVSVSPQSRTALAARLGLDSEETMRLLTAFLKSLGVDHVFDTVLARDVSLYECGREFVDRRERIAVDPAADKLPLICGACPGWICYAEKTQPQLIPHLSRVKSPQQIMGTLVKHFFYAKVLQQSVAPSHIFHATIMPCYDKKLEASRPEFFDETFQTRDVDCVIATSELLAMIEERCGLAAFATTILSPNVPLLDDALSLVSADGRQLVNHGGSGAGGYLEHVMRFAAKRLFNVDFVFGEDGHLVLSSFHEATHQLVIQTQRNADYQDYVLMESASGRVLLRFAKVYGFRNVQTLVRKIKSRRLEYDYVEVMACPGACLNGGGQPRPDSAVQTPMQNFALMDDIYRRLPIAEPLVSPRTEAIYREWLGGHDSPLLKASFRAVEKTLLTSNFSVQW